MSYESGCAERGTWQTIHILVLVILSRQYQSMGEMAARDRAWKIARYNGLQIWIENILNIIFRDSSFQGSPLA